MSDNTPRLSLPYIQASQSQKETTHNEGLNVLDVTVQPVVQSRQAAPPDTPAEGNAYIVTATATGAWAGKEDHIVQYIGAAWVFYAPFEGMKFYSLADANDFQYKSSAWVVFSAGGGGGGAPDLTNYIASGRKFTTGADLNMTISAGVEAISGETVEREGNTLALHASRAQLIYDTKAGTTGIIDAAFPAADAGTVCRYIIDGGATIANTAADPTKGGALSKSGTVTAVPGWAADNAGQGDGSTGSYASANSTGLPTGVNPTVALECLFTVVSLPSAERYFAGYGSDTNYFCFGLTTGNKLSYGPAWDSGFSLEAGKTYFADASCTGTTGLLRVNGVQVDTRGTGLSIAASPFVVYRFPAGGYNAAIIVHYVALRNTLRTPDQIAAISNALLLFCQYNNSGTIIDALSLLPADSIGLGFVRSDATHPTESNDDDYKYGRRERAVNGNRRLGPDYFGWTASTGSLSFDNPFAATNLRVEVMSKTSATATTASKVPAAGVAITNEKISLTSTGTAYISMVAEVID